MGRPFSDSLRSIDNKDTTRSADGSTLSTSLSRDCDADAYIHFSSDMFVQQATDISLSEQSVSKHTSLLRRVLALTRERREVTSLSSHFSLAILPYLLTLTCNMNSSIAEQIVGLFLQSRKGSLPKGFALTNSAYNEGLNFWRRKQDDDTDRTPHPKEPYELDKSIVKKLWEKGDVELGYTRVFEQYNWVDFANQILRLCRDEHLMLITIERRLTVTSGAHGTSQRTMDILRELPAFAALFQEFETEFDIKHCFCVMYLDEGYHPFHMDGGYRGTHRILISLGCLEKEMWFRKMNKLDGVKVRHGSVITLSKDGGGVTSSTSHGSRKTGKSMFICLEVVKK